MSPTSRSGTRVGWSAPAERTGPPVYPVRALTARFRDGSRSSPRRPDMRSRAPITRTLLALLAALGVVLALAGPIAGPAAADHTAFPTRVTLMGSLMSELGCVDGPDDGSDPDWDPDCTLTDMERVGTTSVFELDATLPAGSYAFKVRLNGSWDENYGAGGVPGGPDIPLVLQHEADLTFSYDHASHRVGVAPTEAQPGLTPADSELALDSLRRNLTREQF